MSDPQHPTNKQWVLMDPLTHKPPRGVSLLLINEGGVLITGQWYEGALAWGTKPVIPATVKARLTQKQKQSEISNATKPTSGSLDPSPTCRRAMGVQMRLWHHEDGPRVQPEGVQE